MPREQLTFEQRQAKILQVAETNCDTELDAAEGYLHAIEGASVSEQVQLCRLMLVSHGAVRYKQRRRPKGRNWPAKQLTALVDRLAGMVTSWARSMKQLNASEEDTAKTLWNKLTLCEGDDRVVALALLLRTTAVPYAQIPPDLLLLKPEDVYDEAYDRVAHKVALLMRVKSSGVTPLELAEAFARVLEQTEDHDERVAILHAFFSKEAQKIVEMLDDLLFRFADH